MAFAQSNLWRRTLRLANFSISTYGTHVINPVNRKTDISTAPSRVNEAGSHLPFSHFLGISGHKLTVSVNLAVPFKDLSWGVISEGKRNRRVDIIPWHQQALRFPLSIVLLCDPFPWARTRVDSLLFLCPGRALEAA